MVASADVKFPVRLESFLAAHEQAYSSTALHHYFCTVFILLFYYLAHQYEPEIFPGLVYRMENPKLVLLVFVSGKIVITGAKVQLTLRTFLSFQSRHDIDVAFGRIYSVLLSFRRS